MALKLYNTLTRKRELFKPINPPKVNMYTCGPTVYDYAHIGNFRAYVVADLLKRYLTYNNKFKVKHVMNITDVDDKTIKNSIKQKTTLKKFTEKYTKAFFEDIKKLNIKPANNYPKATQHIKEIVSMIKKLLKKGIAYKSEDNSIYFNVFKFKNYGKLANIEIKNLKSGARVKQDEYEKESLHDFALWKAWDNADGNIFWETELGKGRPGWHIECSAMSSKFLGKQFDIHTGGIDLIFPHHENEIAQIEAITCKKFVKYWVHNEHLLVDGRKMSKSLGNFYTLRDILKKGYDPIAVRYSLISTHYQQQLNFTFEDLDASKSTIQKLTNFVRNLDDIKSKRESNNSKHIEKHIKNTKEGFEEAMDDNLNISNALGEVFSFMHLMNAIIHTISKKEAQKIKETILNFDEVLGLGLKNLKKSTVPKEISDLVKQRETARKNQDWKAADQLRDKITKLGYSIKDTKEGSQIKKIS
ncbi:cysteine--tRNA ligase [Candidatus Woesearchaeota archaeon]|nr:cysteine--tRNA ligase [Candidatus Woesearchaeota archaeon]